jgi:hypothetical protein
VGGSREGGSRAGNECVSSLPSLPMLTLLGTPEVVYLKLHLSSPPTLDEKPLLLSVETEKIVELKLSKDDLPRLLKVLKTRRVVRISLASSAVAVLMTDHVQPLPSSPGAAVSNSLPAVLPHKSKPPPPATTTASKPSNPSKPDSAPLPGRKPAAAAGARDLRSKKVEDSLPLPPPSPPPVKGEGKHEKKERGRKRVIELDEEEEEGETAPRKSKKVKKRSSSAVTTSKAKATSTPWATESSAPKATQELIADEKADEVLEEDQEEGEGGLEETLSQLAGLSRERQKEVVELLMSQMDEDEDGDGGMGGFEDGGQMEVRSFPLSFSSLSSV